MSHSLEQSTEQEHHQCQPSLFDTGSGGSTSVSDVDGSGGHSTIIDQSPPLAGATCQHVFEYDGRSAAGTHPRCDQPRKLTCAKGCGTVQIARCGSTRAARCGPCSESHRLRLVQIAKSGAAGDSGSRVFWCTLTAPGAKVLEFDRALCTHGPEVRCSGRHGCKVHEFDGAVWNGTAPKRWSYVRQYLVRALGVDVQVFGVWEWQQRGVLHRHFIARAAGPVSERRMRQAIGSLRTALGFGPQIDCQAITADAAQQIYYAAKYATKTADDVSGHRLLDPRTGELKESRGFRSWSCSRQWGTTMKELKAAQARWAAAAAVGAAPSALSVGGAAGGGAAVALDLNTDISTTVVRSGGPDPYSDPSFDVS